MSDNALLLSIDTTLRIISFQLYLVAILLACILPHVVYITKKVIDWSKRT